VLSISAAAADGQEWVYQNTPVVTQDRHRGALRVTILSEAQPGEGYLVTLDENGQTGMADFTVAAVEFADGGLTVSLAGGRVGASTPTAPASASLRVTLTGLSSGQSASAVFPLQLRRLGDIDGNGVVNAVDLWNFERRMLNVAVAYPERCFDLTGDGLINAVDVLQMRRLVNGVPIP
jgi:hypothetical protein